ncbi:MAG: NlpC/P60 family protein [Myxococcota bacterium]
MTLLFALLMMAAEARDNTPALQAAQPWMGTPYQWGGRGTASHPGMDCLGILFRAYGAVDGVPWTAYAVNPSELVASGRLGQPVPGLSGIERGRINLEDLKPGDVLYFLIEGHEIPDAPLHVEGDARFWPWHTGMYVRDGTVLHAAPGDVVTVQPLDEIPFDRLLVTRP